MPMVFPRDIDAGRCRESALRPKTAHPDALDGSTKIFVVVLNDGSPSGVESGAGRARGACKPHEGFSSMRCIHTRLHQYFDDDCLRNDETVTECEAARVW